MNRRRFLKTAALAAAGAALAPILPLPQVEPTGIFSAFDPEIHVVRALSLIPKGWQLIWAVDHGYSNCSVEIMMFTNAEGLILSVKNPTHNHQNKNLDSSAQTIETLAT